MSTSPSNTSILIIGAGIFGASAARELAKRGYNITIIDSCPEIPNPQASGTDISKLVRIEYGNDFFLTQACINSIKMWNDFSLDWNKREPEKLFYANTGVLMTSRKAIYPGDGSFVGDSWRTCQKLSPDTILPLSKNWTSLFPAWEGTDRKYGFFNSLGGFVASSNCVNAMLLDASEAGSIVIPDCGAKEFLFDPNSPQKPRVIGVKTSRGNIYADKVIVAGGAWSPGLVPHLNYAMKPTAQHLMFFNVPEAFAKEHQQGFGADIENSGFYGFPPLKIGKDWVFKIGLHGDGIPVDPFSLEPNESNVRGVSRVGKPSFPAPVPLHLEPLFRKFLQECFPKVANAPLHSGSELNQGRRCLYCDTRDGDFIISKDPEIENLFIHTGGSGHGMKFGPMLGIWIADLMEGNMSSDAKKKFGWRWSSDVLGSSTTFEAARFIERKNSSGLASIDSMGVKGTTFSSLSISRKNMNSSKLKFKLFKL